MTDKIDNLRFVEEISKSFAYLNSSALCFSSFIYKKYFENNKIVYKSEEQLHSDIGDLDCTYTIFLILMLFYNLDNKDVCLKLTNLAQSNFKAYKTYEKERLDAYKFRHIKEQRNLRTIDINKDLFKAYLDRVKKGLVKPIYAFLQDVSDTKSTFDDSNDSVSCIKDERPFVLSFDRLYVRRSFLYENFIASYIAKKAQNKNINLDKDKIKDLLAMLFDKEAGDECNHQLLSALLSLYQNFCVISGGPGTGKTTTVLKLLFMHLYLNQDKDLRIKLCAPTGKAAGRMKESIINGKKALAYKFKDNDYMLNLLDMIPTESSTIHTLIGVKAHSSLAKFNENNKLVTDILIVDEVSMVDMALFVKLLKALDDNTVVIMLGDKDQLCSVEAGSILGDICSALFKNKILSDDTLDYLSYMSGYTKESILKSQALTEIVSLLVKSHRFKEGSAIYNLASSVNTNLSNESKDTKIKSVKSLISSIVKNKDCGVFIQTIKNLDTYQDTMSLINDITNEAIDKKDESGPQNYSAYLNLLKSHDFFVSDGCDDDNCLKVTDVFKQLDRYRILCSNRDGVLGCNRLSKEIEMAICKKYGFGQNEFFPGRVILVTRNNKILKLNNGDVGFIAKDIRFKGGDKENNLYVWFISSDINNKGQCLRVPIGFLDSFESGFCMTIHKSQGSEYEHVKIALSLADNNVLTKELIYTAITRAKEYATLLYNEKVFYEAIGREVQRESGLENRLSYLFKNRQ